MRESNSHWQKILAQGFSSAAELLAFLEISVPAYGTSAEEQFKTRVPRGFAARMQPGNINDPLLLQVLAQTQEMEITPGYSNDPLKEKQANPIPGLIHKYHGRVLLTLTGVCAVHCRYCFRRHFPYADNNPGRQGWEAALAYIAAENTIHEVILSGGDPLLASDAMLTKFCARLTTIPHLKTLRIHTRIPIVLPERITDDLEDLLAALPLNKIVVIHSNHPNELNQEVKVACRRLLKADCRLLNQSVLLKNINDQVDILALLSEKLLTYGILPYYLHLLDKVQGAAHFDVSLADAQVLMQALQQRLPGYLVPRLAREEAGGASKIWY